MPDNINALYPQQQPQNNLFSDPTKVLGLLGQVNQLQQFQETFGAQKAVGEIIGKHIKNGVLDEKGAIQEIAGTPRAAFGAPKAVGDMLERQGQQLSNTQKQIVNEKSAFDMRAAQSDYVVNKIGSLADQKEPVTDEQLRNFVVGAARQSGVRPQIIDQWRRSIPPESDQAGRRAAIAQFARMTMGPAEAAAPGVTGYEGAAPVAGTAGQAALIKRGGGTVAGAPGIATPQPGLAEAQTAEAKTGQEAATALQNAASQIPNQRTALDLMRNDIRQAGGKEGPLSEYERVANTVANRVLGFRPTMTKEEQRALDSFDKVAKTVALTQAGTLHATDNFLTTALGANPNTKLPAYSNEGLIDFLHGNNDLVALKAREWNRVRASKGTDKQGPDQFFSWENDFNSKIDPRVFQYKRMGKGDQELLLNSLPDRGEFETHYVEHAKRGWLGAAEKKRIEEELARQKDQK